MSGNHRAGLLERLRGRLWRRTIEQSVRDSIAELVQEAAESVAVPMPLAGLLRDRFLAALARNEGDLDWAALARIAAVQAGL